MPGSSQYVEPIGMLLIDSNYLPETPGTPGNVSAFEIPLRYRVVEGCTVDRLIYAGDDSLAAPIVAAARELVADGARAITSNCGFMIRHQAAVSNAVDVPVLLSCLLLAPLLLSCMGSTRKLGIVTASATSMTTEVLRRAGISDPARVVVADLEDQPAFRAGNLDYSGIDRSAIERETVDVASALVEKNPDISTLLLECTGLPLYAAAVERAVGLPVFDSARLIDLFATGFAPPAAQRLLVDGNSVGYLPQRAG